MSRRQLLLLTILCGWLAVAFLASSYHSLGHDSGWLALKQQELAQKRKEIGQLKVEFVPSWEDFEWINSAQTKNSPEAERPVAKSRELDWKGFKARQDNLNSEITALGEEIRAGNRVTWAFHVFPTREFDLWGLWYKGHEDLSKFLAFTIPALIIALPMWFWFDKGVVPGTTGKSETKP
jgi:hypothetical protein